MIKCMICGILSKDLSQHIRRVHDLSTKGYKVRYSAPVVDSSVEATRRETCQEKYGDPNYKNREAIGLSFEVYEGGHPLKDPYIRKKAEDTMEKRYGVRRYTNREKAKETTRRKYGVDYTCQVPEVIEKRIQTLKERYGKVFNTDGVPSNKTDIPEDFKDIYQSGETMEQLGKRYGVTEPTVLRWVRDSGLKRDAVKQTKRRMQSPREVAEAYIRVCRDRSSVLSFYEYGKIAGTSGCTKLKRLFNKGKKYEHFRDQLFKAVDDPSVYSSLLGDLSGI